jgi:CheY-like chemotaxis protein
MEEAWNGQMALDYYEALSKEEDGLSKAPEIILLDLNMPVMDGWEFLEIFLKKYPQFSERTMVFVVTSSINPADKIRSHKEDAVKGFLSKPLDGVQIAVLKEFIDTGIKAV